MGGEKREQGLSIIHFTQIKSDLPSPPEARISSVKETNKNSVVYVSYTKSRDCVNIPKNIHTSPTEGIFF